MDWKLIPLLVIPILVASERVTHAALATDCTLYVAAAGSDSNNGLTPSTPKLTLDAVSELTVPGSVVCLKGGTFNLSASFYPATNGTASAWITYKAYGDGTPIINWVTGSEDIDMFHFFSGTLPLTASTGVRYIEVRGLTFNGNNIAANAFKCARSHHLRFIGNTINNTGAAGIATKFCDYITADGNQITHAGYNHGWSSAISYNSHQFLDAAAGFHSYVVNNVISGTFDGSVNNTDGSGVIMDLSDDTTVYASANTPAVLIANNVIFENGGRCVELFVVTNIWVVNNTCYKNTLDLTQSGTGEMVANKSNNSYFINNAVYTWNNRQAFQQLTPTANLTYYKNVYFGGTLNFTPSDPTQFIASDPLYLSPPAVDPSAGGQYATAVVPASLGTALTLQATSPAINAGIDPTTLPGLAPEIVAGLRLYILWDINGNTRPQGGAFDLGAYETIWRRRTPSLF